MNNVVFRVITLSNQYQALTSQPSEVLTVTVHMPVRNKQDVVFRGEGGTEVPLQKGTQFELKKVNLAEIRVKGRPGDKIILVGGTW